jgi:epoxyqueuosine reductase QueG
METSKEINYKNLESFLEEKKIRIFGIADVEQMQKDSDQSILFPEISSFKFAVSIGLPLSSGILDTIKDKPNRIYLHHYRQTNYRLDILSCEIANFIEDSGYTAMPIAASLTLDKEKDSAQLSHKETARYAGIGWIGKNNLLIHPKYGARVRYATILTDMPLKVNSQPLSSQCEKCNLCLEVCPAGAISSDKFDKDKCFKQVRLFGKKENLGHSICGLCVKVCKPL